MPVKSTYRAGSAASRPRRSRRTQSRVTLTRRDAVSVAGPFAQPVAGLSRKRSEIRSRLLTRISGGPGGDDRRGNRGVAFHSGRSIGPCCRHPSSLDGDFSLETLRQRTLLRSARSRPSRRRWSAIKYFLTDTCGRRRRVCLDRRARLARPGAFAARPMRWFADINTALGEVLRAARDGAAYAACQVVFSRRSRSRRAVIARGARPGRADPMRSP